VSALATSAAKILPKRKKPVFDMTRRVMTIDGKPAPSERFEE
jgi:hypothetical protein